MTKQKKKSLWETTLLWPTASLQWSPCLELRCLPSQCLPGMPSETWHFQVDPGRVCAPYTSQQALPFSSCTFPVPHQDLLPLICSLPRCSVGNNLPAKHVQLLSHLLSFANGVPQRHKTSWENKRHLPQRHLIIWCFRGMVFKHAAGARKFAHLDFGKYIFVLWSALCSAPRNLSFMCKGPGSTCLV